MEMIGPMEAILIELKVGILPKKQTMVTLADFLNWMPSTEPQDDGVAEDIQESAEAALVATSQGI